MPLVAETKTFTPEDLLALNDYPSYELVDGQLVEKNMGAMASRIGFVIALLLESYGANKRIGLAVTEATFQCFKSDPNRVRRPDAAFISFETLGGTTLPEGHIQTAPELVVEVISPHDTAYDVERKIAEYLEAGVRQVWAVYPRQRTVRIVRSNGTGTELRGDAQITGEDVIPGFTCNIAEFFKTI
ncbi:MAG TPA: Uma2 family endonuclease [Planctomycetota bacterium]|nr:Uma2 family endonuclease [Planctomycetota bacterium]